LNEAEIARLVENPVDLGLVLPNGGGDIDRLDLGIARQVSEDLQLKHGHIW
jgi:hypothetical protein